MNYVCANLNNFELPVKLRRAPEETNVHQIIYKESVFLLPHFGLHETFLS